MTAELVERRVLGAVQFVDSTTGRRVRTPLALDAAGVRFVRNHSAMYVLMTAPGLTDYTLTFQPTPATPPSVAIAGTVSDPSLQYLTRRFTLTCPGDANPGPPLPANSVFRPVSVRLFPAPAASTLPTWAVVRAHVTRGGADVAGALVRVVRRSDRVRIGTGISDARGETLVTVPGIPLVNWDQGAGPVLVSQIDVTLETVFDPNAAAPPDPDGLDARAAASSVDSRLGAGTELIIGLTVPIA